MATVSVRISTPLRSLTTGAHEVSIPSNTVGDVTGTRANSHKGIGERIITSEGELRNFLNLILGHGNSRNPNGSQTHVSYGDVLSIIPAFAGGRP